ncbi:glycosyltransferase involved in cell wall biosynthesis [Microbacterium sp. AG1240]|uniref:glycosyltransferase family 4 protein n=1 Tax=Microbacterium sp. AG1240 TaxID=2183992 RepID=UPI000EB35040|nr:glycosyltransferase family 4 protein [Microbacterium sp. AG1240]RKT36345.1 glycosyltransferase involved in cell wall biosynthesis [Microbacterium sp. AG1240]
MSTDETVSDVHFLLPAPALTPIGGYKVVYEYADALVSRGVDVTVWHSSIFNAFESGRFSRYRAAILAAGLWRRRLTGRATTSIPWYRLDPRVRVKVTSARPRPKLGRRSVVVATAVQTTDHVAEVARRAGATSLALIQHFETWAAPEDVIRRAWARVDERIVIAPWLAELCSQAGLSSVLLTNALDVDSFPTGAPLAQRRPMVMSLLSPHGYKRPDVVAHALGAVRAGRPDARVVAFGIDPVPPRPLAPGVEYVCDPSPEVLRELYRSASVYLCGSDAEGWHLPPAEATLSGAAVVSTDIGGVRASMGDEALYGPPGDGEALASLAERVLENPDAAQLRVDTAAARIRSVTYGENTRALLDIAAAVRKRQS